MIEKYVQALTDGKIVSVDWRSIQEMLGENGGRVHACSICIDDNSFPPKVEDSNDFTEDQICEILNKAGVEYMAEKHKDNVLYLPIEVRWFACHKPEIGPWIENPNRK